MVNQTVTLPEYAQVFLNDLDVQANTRQAYRYQLALFARFMEATCGDTDLMLLDKDCLSEFKKWMISGAAGKSYAAVTARATVTVARRMLMWLVKRQRLPNRMLARALQEEGARRNLPGCAREFLENHEISPCSKEAYRNGLFAFFLFTERIYGTTDVTQLDENCLGRFSAWLTNAEGDGRGCTVSTARAYLAAVKGLMLWLDTRDQLPNWSLTRALRELKAQMEREQQTDHGDLTGDPGILRIVAYYDEMPLPEMSAAKTSIPKRERRERNQIRQERLRILRARALVHTLFSTGARVREVVSLKRQDVAREEEGTPIAIQNRVLISGQKQTERYLFFIPEAQEAIKAYLTERGDDGNEWLFASHSYRHKGYRLARNTVWTTVKKAVRALDLQSDTCTSSFRRFVAVRLLDGGLPLLTVQELLDHEGTSSTIRTCASMIITTEGHSTVRDASSRELVALPDTGPAPPDVSSGLEELLARFGSATEDVAQPDSDAY